MIKKTYNMTRKYPLETYGNVDLSVEDLESREELTKELKHFDKIATEYKNKLNQCCDDFPNCSHTQKEKSDTPF